MEKSDHSVTLIDLCGEWKHLKTILSEKEIQELAIATNAQHFLWIFTITKLPVYTEGV